MHSAPNEPEVLVRGHQRSYFDFFYDSLSQDPTRIAPALRNAHASAYSASRALTAGFNWYRAFPADAEQNQKSVFSAKVATPLLYIRGERETGAIDDYVRELGDAGMINIEHTLIPPAGYFTQEEAPVKSGTRLRRSAAFEDPARLTPPYYDSGYRGPL